MEVTPVDLHKPELPAPISEHNELTHNDPPSNSELLSNSESASNSKSTSNLEPAPIVEISPIVEPAPIVEPSPIIEPSPIVETAPSVEPSPGVEPAPSSEHAPSSESVPSSEPSPCSESVPNSEPAPTSETTLEAEIDEPKRIEQLDEHSVGSYLESESTKDNEEERSTPQREDVSAAESNADSEDDYDPEAAFSVADDENKGASSYSEEQVEVAQEKTEGTEQPGTEKFNSEDEYDVEAKFKLQESASAKEEKKPALPPKPQLQPQPQQQSPDAKLKEAYEAVMKSDLVQLPEFAAMSQEEQMKTIQRLLQEKNISMPQADAQPHDPDMNYDQVYSYNKPFKYLKDPIPLVPLNKFCRRPNITIPMTPEERKAYDDFLELEVQNPVWNTEFPDNLRLFVGNLPANTITKEDLFRIFSQYGDLAEISIKGGYGFVQFRTAEACADCMKGEANVPLHNKIMRLDASRSRSNASRGRERSQGDDVPSAKRARTSNTDCQVFVTAMSTSALVDEVETVLKERGINFKVKDIGSAEVSDEVSESAYLGVVGACVIKESKLDLQIFEETEDGGIKFDEYVDIDPSVMTNIISSAKLKHALKVLERREHDRRRPASSLRNDSRFNDRRDGRGRGPRHNDNGPYGHGHNWQRGHAQSPRQWDSGLEYNSSGGYGNQGAYQQPDYHQNHNQRFGHQQGPYQSYDPRGNQSYGQGYGARDDRSYGQGFQGPNQGYGQPPIDGQGGWPQQSSYSQNYPNQGGYNGGSFPGQQSPSQPNPALLQTLQNLDPAAMQNVVSLLQQKAPNPNAAFQSGYGAQAPPPNMALNQFNPVPSLLPPQPPYQPYNGSQQLQYYNAAPPQQPPQPYNSAAPPQQPYNSTSQQHSYSGGPQQRPTSSALMDMLTRLGKQ